MNSKNSKFEKLIESFYEGMKKNGEYEEIYVNPTSSEMDEVSKKVNPTHDFGMDNAWMKYQNKADNYVRFTATSNKKVYAFSPWILHEDLDSKFGIEQSKDIFIHGVARKISGKWTAVEMHNVEYVFREKKEEYRREDYASHDWSWIDKYITTTPLYKKIIHEYITNPNTTKFKKMADS